MLQGVVAQIKINTESSSLRGRFQAEEIYFLNNA